MASHVPPSLKIAFAGPHQGLGDGLCRCRRLLPRLKRHRLGGQRRKRPSFHPAVSSDDVA